MVGFGNDGAHHGGGDSQQGVRRHPFYEGRYENGDPLYRESIDYTAERGIPYTAFLTWTPDDRARALAWVRAESARCPGCGVHRWAREDFVDHYEFDFDRCPVCEKRDAKKHDSKGKTGFGHGLIGRWWRKG